MSFQNTKNNLEYNHPIRSPSEVMKLDRLGSFHQTRLSFTRRLIDDLTYQQSKIEIHRWDIDNRGIGSAIIKIIENNLKNKLNIGKKIGNFVKKIKKATNY